MAFKEDLKMFADFLTGCDDPVEVKKEYRKMMKKYHPDHSEEKDKSICNEYVLIINQVYIHGKAKTKETVIDGAADENKGRSYVFTRTGPDGRQYSYKCRDYYDYLYKVARNEFNTGHEILHFHNLNYLDKKAVEQNSFEVLQHYRNSIKCMKFILKNCKDPIILSSCRFDVGMVQNAINALSRTIAESDEKGLVLS